MLNLKVGDAVLFLIQGRALNALVLRINTGEVEHLGKDGEPLLDLAFLDQARESKRTQDSVSYLPEVFFEYGVVHFSQKFSDDYIVAKGLTTKAQVIAARGQGEWKLPAAPKAVPPNKKPPTSEKPADPKPSADATTKTPESE